MSWCKDKQDDLDAERETTVFSWTEALEYRGERMRKRKPTVCELIREGGYILESKGMMVVRVMDDGSGECRLSTVLCCGYESS